MEQRRVMLVCLTGETSRRLAGVVRHLAKQVGYDLDVMPLGVESARNEPLTALKLDAIALAEQAVMFRRDFVRLAPDIPVIIYGLDEQPASLWRKLGELWQR